MKELFNHIIFFFQDRKEWDRVNGKMCFCNDFTEVYLIKEFDLIFLVIENIEISNYLECKANVTFHDQDQMKELLNHFIKE